MINNYTEEIQKLEEEKKKMQDRINAYYAEQLKDAIRQNENDYVGKYYKDGKNNYFYVFSAVSSNTYRVWTLAFNTGNTKLIAKKNAGNRYYYYAEDALNFNFIFNPFAVEDIMCTTIRDTFTEITKEEYENKVSQMLTDIKSNFIDVKFILKDLVESNENTINK